MAHLLNSALTAQRSSILMKLGINPRLGTCFKARLATFLNALRANSSSGARIQSPLCPMESANLAILDARDAPDPPLINAQHATKERYLTQQATLALFVKKFLATLLMRSFNARISAVMES